MSMWISERYWNITNILRMNKIEQIVRTTEERWHTFWGCTNIARLQGHFTQASRIITHKLRMHRHWKMVRVNSHKNQELSLTSWGCTDVAKWSGSLHTSIKNHHSHTEDPQTLQNGQGHFTQASRIITHFLRMHRHCKMGRVTSHKHQECSLTGWGCTDIAKWSGSLLTCVKNDHSLPEDAQTLQMVIATSHNHQEWSHTIWDFTNIETCQCHFIQALWIITHMLRMYGATWTKVTSHKHWQRSLTFCSQHMSMNYTSWHVDLPLGFAYIKHNSQSLISVVSPESHLHTSCQQVYFTVEKIPFKHTQTVDRCNLSSTIVFKHDSSSDLLSTRNNSAHNIQC